MFALNDSPLPLPNSLYTFGLGTRYSPCLQLSDQFNWFTHQLLTTSGCGRYLGRLEFFLSCCTLFPVSRWGRYDSNCILCVTHLLLWISFIHAHSISSLRVHSLSALLWFLLGGYLLVSSFPSHTHTFRFPWSTGLTPSVFHNLLPSDRTTCFTFPNLYTAFSHHSAAVEFALYIDGLTTQLHGRWWGRAKPSFHLYLINNFLFIIYIFIILYYFHFVNKFWEIYWNYFWQE